MAMQQPTPTWHTIKGFNTCVARRKHHTTGHRSKKVKKQQVLGDEQVSKPHHLGKNGEAQKCDTR